MFVNVGLGIRSGYKKMTDGAMVKITVGTWLILGLVSLVQPNPDAKRLYDDLLSNYNRLIRPVANNTDKITVKMGLKLSQLVDLVRIILLLYI